MNFESVSYWLINFQPNPSYFMFKIRKYTNLPSILFDNKSRTVESHLFYFLTCMQEMINFIIILSQYSKVLEFRANISLVNEIDTDLFSI